MRYSMIAVSALGLFWGVAACFGQESAGATTEAPPGAEAVELTTNDQKVNYSLGFELGKDLKGQELPLQPDALLRGAQDGISGAKPLISTSQRQKALREIRAKRAQEQLEQAQAFLAANAEKEGVQTLPSGLQYKEIQAGEGRTPGLGDSVVVHYRGSLIDGTEFDSSYERGKPASFQVKKVIKGWKEGLQLMKEGAKWELVVPPDLGYGKRGRGKTIPPNSVLIFEVELVSIK